MENMATNLIIACYLLDDIYAYKYTYHIFIGFVVFVLLLYLCDPDQTNLNLISKAPPCSRSLKSISYSFPPSFHSGCMTWNVVILHSLLTTHSLHRHSWVWLLLCTNGYLWLTAYLLSSHLPDRQCWCHVSGKRYSTTSLIMFLLTSCCSWDWSCRSHCSMCSARRRLSFWYM